MCVGGCSGFHFECCGSETLLVCWLGGVFGAIMDGSQLLETIELRWGQGL